MCQLLAISKWKLLLDRNLDIFGNNLAYVHYSVRHLPIWIWSPLNSVPSSIMLRSSLSTSSLTIEESLAWIKSIFKYKVGTAVYFVREKLDMTGSIERECISLVTSFVSWRNLGIGSCAANTEWNIAPKRILTRLRLCASHFTKYVSKLRDGNEKQWKKNLAQISRVTPCNCKLLEKYVSAHCQ